MKYIMTGIELHPDFGFGVTADAYYKSAEHLMQNHFEHYDVTQQAEMPQNFLFRHTIELYLKSLIILFHKKLELDYGTVDFNSDEPEALFDGKWRKLYSCHFIDKLYEYWLNNLLLPNVKILQEIAPEGDWAEYQKVTELFEIISRYDQDSSYFRYPITKNANLDNKKYSMQKFKAVDLESFLEEIKERKADGKGRMTMLMVDDKDNITSAFSKDENILSDVRDALKEVAYYFNGIHVMSRVTLFDGM
ncbi:hypothetical protein [Flavobacterium sp. '19STA2R22 D10 B1']|uniref:hypothetical protein n=1 Tax=Flavobacterium aerium TaxID=3037261 RepID=UPI00278C5DD4|nr:hypothetical protein [Flavobacterium sp. '19STA2R22 D10 B1']